MHGARVALLEARRESELASLVRRHGGEPVCVPALREAERDFRDELERASDAIVRGGAVVVLTTGTGLERVLRLADATGKGTALRASLERSTVVCRGPKPVAVLKREHLPVHVRAQEPHTTRELLAALDEVHVQDVDVVVVDDGGTSRAVVDSLLRRRARVIHLRPYAWALPEDVGPLRALVDSIVAGRVDAVAVTTQVQARNLFEVAESMGAAAALTQALRDRVIVAAVGPTCARVLEELGAPPHVVPESAKMGAMVLALAKKLDRHG